MNRILASLASAMLLALGLVPAVASAEVGVNTSITASTSVTAGGIHAGASADLEAKAKTRADQEIDRRITNLNELIARIDGMKKLTSGQKTSLKASLSAEVSTLTALKAKIDADTDLAILKADVQSIAKSYRVYMLVLPQGRISAVVDRVENITGNMQTLAAKLKARMDAAPNSTNDATYADLQAKIADANTQASAALALTVNLKPDNGDAAVQASNTAALKDAKAKLATATADLKAARADITTLIKALGGVHGGASATTTVETH